MRALAVIRSAIRYALRVKKSSMCAASVARSAR